MTKQNYLLCIFKNFCNFFVGSEQEIWMHGAVIHYFESDCSRVPRTWILSISNGIQLCCNLCKQLIFCSRVLFVLFCIAGGVLCGDKSRKVADSGSSCRVASSLPFTFYYIILFTIFLSKHGSCSWFCKPLRLYGSPFIIIVLELDGNSGQV